MIKLVVEPYCQNCKEFEPDFEKQVLYSDTPKRMEICNTVIFCQHRDRCNWVIDNYFNLKEANSNERYFADKL